MSYDNHLKPLPTPSSPVLVQYSTTIKSSDGILLSESTQICIKTSFTKKKFGPQLTYLCTYVHESPCIYLDELQAYMAFQHDVALTKARYDSLLRDCGFSYKQLQKFAAERDVGLRTHFAEWCNNNLTARMIWPCAASILRPRSV